MKKDKKKRLRRLAGKREQRRSSRNKMMIEGILSMTQSGFGFVKIEIPEDMDIDSPQDIFIPPQYVNGAIEGDRVRVELLPPGGNPDKCLE